MKAIFKRELKAYFTSPLIYILISVYILFSAVIFFRNNIFIYHTPELNNVFYACNFLMHLIIPFITMRLFAEEKAFKTDQLLLTSPNSVTAIVLGKYFSAVAVTFIMIAFSAFYALTVGILTTFDIPMYLLLVLGATLINCALVSVGLYISASVGNVMVSALVTLGALLIIYFSGTVSAMFAGKNLFTKFFSIFDLSMRFDDFSMGLLSIESIVYYISFSAVFIFLAVRVTDKRRLE